MQDFLQWVEAKSQIRVIGYSKTGEIRFAAGANTYTFVMDAGYFYNGFFAKWLKYQPGKALNFAKEKGELIKKNGKPVQPDPPPIQQELF